MRKISKLEKETATKQITLEQVHNYDDCNVMPKLIPSCLIKQSWTLLMYIIVDALFIVTSWENWLGKYIGTGTRIVSE